MVQTPTFQNRKPPTKPKLPSESIQSRTRRRRTYLSDSDVSSLSDIDVFWGDSDESDDDTRISKGEVPKSIIRPSKQTHKRDTTTSIHTRTPKRRKLGSNPTRPSLNSSPLKQAPVPHPHAHNDTHPPVPVVPSTPIPTIIPNGIPPAPSTSNTCDTPNTAHVTQSKPKRVRLGQKPVPALRNAENTVERDVKRDDIIGHLKGRVGSEATLGKQKKMGREKLKVGSDGGSHGANGSNKGVLGDDKEGVVKNVVDEAAGTAKDDKDASVKSGLSKRAKVVAVGNESTSAKSDGVIPPKRSRRSLGVKEVEHAAQNGTSVTLNGWPLLVHDKTDLDLQVQAFPCKSGKYGHYDRCRPCLAKKGEPCRFQGMRAFRMKDKTPIEDPYFFSDKPMEDVNVPSIPHSGNFPPLSDATAYKLCLSYTAFRECIDRELAHITAYASGNRTTASLHCIKRPIPLTRQTCDICEQGIYNTYYMCTICGRDMCLLCVEEGWGVPNGHASEAVTSTVVKSFKDTDNKPTSVKNPIMVCSFRRTHDMRNFLVISRWDIDQMTRSRDWVKGWMNQHANRKLGINGTAAPSNGIDAHSDEHLNGKDNQMPNGTTHIHSAETANIKMDDSFDVDSLINAPHPDLVIIPYEQLTVPLFQHYWRQRKAIFVTDMANSVTDHWKPQVFEDLAGEEIASLIDCKSGKIHSESPLASFFKGFGKREGDGTIVKLKDWPSDMHFRAKLPKHSTDFLDLIPIPEYTHPDGKFNLVSHISENDVPPDLGPKMYAAYGYNPDQTGGTTNLHLDVADAANVLVSSQRHWVPPSTEPPTTACTSSPENIPPHKLEGAIWDLFPPSTLTNLRSYLRHHYRHPTHPHPLMIDDPIHDQTFYLHPPHLHDLITSHSVRPIRLHQRLGDTVFVPAGFAHQVSNYGDCIKCALDFVSAEGVAVCEDLCREFRRLGKGHGRKGDTVSVGKVVWGVVRSALGEAGG
ncbi:uncharacterized protein SPPG_01621 [Spizellomyces punctatus DAOM BR117]|uniref:JmjC domain-containing protein n=1 Tax=Spizellomyces punctatus (strain DAOM BR117) TaxID=645134 RepID=A0A0L0HSY7_SPIPD|nr:uncharacterized protein SPPG_01621 [Spizellomyces punctatus DAOM BR117]KND04187.1 hypothetical protein SPPG_01621 [Spizellomyces punctatus DAOM BR117]|eukprot:XP_016612226.1 hypothetical protein SPPG_01621 [Spizellomyces punctatus DAOM BR117]